MTHIDVADDAPAAASAKPAKVPQPLPALVDRLVTERGYPLLADAEARPWRDGAGTWVVFLPGHGRGSSETSDVAVILPELVAAHQPRLTPAVAGPAAEQALLPLLGPIALPALVFLRGDALLGSIPRVRDWNDYQERIAAILSGAAA